MQPSVLKAIGVIIAVFGLSLLAHSGLDIQEFTFFAGLGMCFIGSMAYVQGHRIEKLRAKSYDWYKETYPEFIKNGRVTCCKCGDRRIRMSKMMNNQFTNRHECVQCGTALYYSPEK